MPESPVSIDTKGPRSLGGPPEHPTMPRGWGVSGFGLKGFGFGVSPWYTSRFVRVILAVWGLGFRV